MHTTLEHMRTSSVINDVAALSNLPWWDEEAGDWFGVETVDLSGLVATAIRNHGLDGAGKWIRYDRDGKMYKGWYTVGVGNEDGAVYTDQIGNTYYYDRKTGAMAKGTVFIDGEEHFFDEQTGVMQW